MGGKGAEPVKSGVAKGEEDEDRGSSEALILHVFGGRYLVGGGGSNALVVFEHPSTFSILTHKQRTLANLGRRGYTL